MKVRNQVEYRVWGRHALFSDPVTRVGGEKFSYQIPTYQAVKGVTESIFWKPTIIWKIDQVRVMTAIRTEVKHIRPINYNTSGNTLSIYTYLADVEYQVRAHFEWNLNRPDLASDRDEHKYHNIARRMIERGGRRDIFLGTRECQAYVEPCEFGQGKSFYDDVPGELHFGLMFHSFAYPDETGQETLGVRFWRARMAQGGIVNYPPPEEIGPELCRELRGAAAKLFGEGNFSGLDEPGLAALAGEEEPYGLGTTAL